MRISLSLTLFLVTCVAPLGSEGYRGIHVRGIGDHLSTQDDYLVHPLQATNSERPAFSCGYIPPRWFRLEQAGQKVNWAQAMVSTRDGGQQSAHFLLDAVDVIDATGEIGIVVYLASAQAKQDGTYDIRIEITQKRPDSLVTVYDSNGTQLSGPLPLQAKKKRGGKKPYLPWLDGMRQFYSVVTERRDGQLYLLFIQHSKEEIGDYVYTSPTVKDIVEKYSYHARLQNRPDAYLDLSEHMRCLPVPYSHESYRAFADAEFWVSWGVLKGTIEILPS